jgi:hypothetical protein
VCWDARHCRYDKWILLGWGYDADALRACAYPAQLKVLLAAS